MGIDGQTTARGEALKPAPTKQDPKLEPENLKNDHPQDRFGQARQSQAVREALARGVGGDLREIRYARKLADESAGSHYRLG